MKKLLVISIFLFSLMIFPQDNSALDDMKIKQSTETGQFNRKSITFLPLATKSTSQYFGEIMTGLDMIEPTGRYDNNYIKESYILALQKLFEKENFDFTNINSAENLAMLTKILKESKALEQIILSTTNEDSLRARVQRSKKRMVTSALEQMKIEVLTIPQIMTLINNSFIAIPVMNVMDFKDNKYTAYGAYIWLKVVVNFDMYKNSKLDVNLVQLNLVNSQTVQANAYDAFSMENILSKEDDKIKDDIKTSRNFGKNINNMLLSMEEFKVRATIQDLSDGIRIDIGKREGVYLDQGYKVFELRQNEEGKVYSEYMGFIRVDKATDNTVKFDALSSAYTIIPGGFEPGHILVSHDQSFDLLFKGQYRKILIPKEFGTNLIDVNNVTIASPFFKEEVNTSYNLELALMVNGARLFGVTQFFMGIGGSVGMPVTTKFDNSDLTVNVPLTYEAYIFAQKKFWLPSVAFSLQVEAGAKSLSLTGKYKKSGSDKDWEFNSGWNIMVGGLVGLEIAASADLSIGIEAGYDYVLFPLEVKFKYDDKELTLTKDNTYSGKWNASKIGDILLGGLKGGIKVSYSLPPLF